MSFALLGLTNSTLSTFCWLMRKQSTIWALRMFGTGLSLAIESHMVMFGLQLKETGAKTVAMATTCHVSFLRYNIGV